MNIKLLIKIIVIILLLTVGLSIATNFLSEGDTLNNLIGLGCVILICYTVIKLVINETKIINK